MVAHLVEGEALVLIRRDVDPQDARRVRLYPTEKAHENLLRLHAVWSRLLEETVADPDEIDAAIVTPRRMETRLVSRTRGERSPDGGPG